MYSKLRPLLKELATKNQSGFSVRKFLADILYRDDKSSSFYKVAVLDPRQPLQYQSQVIEGERERTYEVSKLANGVTVLTESASSPTRVDLGILLDIGTRDETNETSGSLLSIKNTYFKTVVNTNETINYGIVQMSGGEFGMDYDQETAYFRAHCLAHDAVDVFRMMADCALEPRSVVAANVALEKNKGTHNLEDLIKSGESFNETIFKTAFGSTGLGMPLRGFKNNIGNLNAYTLQKFQQANINPNKLIICAAGVENHQEFVDLANETLSFIEQAEGGLSGREPTQYRGGEVRVLTDEGVVALALLFQSGSWQSKDLPAYQLLNVLLGGRGPYSQSRLQNNIINKNSYADHAESVNFNFSDAGLFGVKIQGSADSGTNLVNDVVRELKNLTNVTNDELSRAKAVLKTNVYLALERQSDRLEEAAKNVLNYNGVQLNNYAQAIDSVSKEQIGSVIGELLRGTPTFVAQGGLANRLPSFDQLQNSLKL